MDGVRFDTLARRVDAAITRRHAAAVVVALTVIPLLDQEETAAKHKKKRKKKKHVVTPPAVCAKQQVSTLCTDGSECCSGRCEETDAPCSPAREICCNPLGQPCQEQCDCCKVNLFHPECFGPPGAFVCCIATGTLGCSKDADCCNEAPPAPQAICDGQSKCCLPSGASCEFDIECCTGKVCQGNPGAKTCS
jgi:hypothetical protein